MAGIPREIVDAARAHEPDRYLAALLAPRAVRDDLVVLAAVGGEIARIPRVVSDPMLGEIRLQWWHDAIERLAAGFASGERTGNPLADALGGVILRHGLPQARLFDCVEARLFELYADPITDDVRGLVRMLAAATALTLSGESVFVGPERDLDRAVRVLETLWLHALWGAGAGG